MSRKFNKFIYRIENDRNNSEIWMSQFIESEQQKELQDMEELQNKLKHLNNKLTDDADTNIESTKRDIRTTQFKIKTLTEKITRHQKNFNKKRDEWNSINFAVDNDRENQRRIVEEYYNKKMTNELTDNDIINELLQVEPAGWIRMSPSIDEIQGNNLDMAKYIEDSEINKDRYYDDIFTHLRGTILTEFENESLAFQTGMPTDKVIPRPPNMNASIERVFEKILPVQKTFYVYRCYYSDISIGFIDKQRKIGRPLSTSLSYNYSYEWACSERSKTDIASETDTGNIMVCIIIPKGTHVIPLHHYLQKYEYEILLSSEGKLCFTGERDPVHNLPIFIYFDSYKQCNQYNVKNLRMYNVVSRRSVSRKRKSITQTTATKTKTPTKTRNVRSI
jgi:hypothetical protein